MLIFQILLYTKEISIYIFMHKFRLNFILGYLRGYFTVTGRKIGIFWNFSCYVNAIANDLIFLITKNSF